MLGHLGRRLAYKVRRKLQPKTITLEGIKLTAEVQDVPKGVRIQLYKKKYEQQEVRLVRAALKKDDRVLEVGAGIGFIGIACAKICGPENILSYEPNPMMKHVIEKNYFLNGFEPNLRSRVVGTATGEVEFYFSDSVLSSSLIDRFQSGATTVKADAISEVVEEYDPSVIVMDAEGAEVELLRECSLDKIEKIIIEMHPHIVGSDEIDCLIEYLIECGYSIEKRLGKTYFFQMI